MIEVWGRDADADDEDDNEDEYDQPTSSNMSGQKRRRDTGEDEKKALTAHIEALFADLK